jgi:hypothetical protein
MVTKIGFTPVTLFLFRAFSRSFLPPTPSVACVASLSFGVAFLCCCFCHDRAFALNVSRIHPDR